MFGDVRHDGMRPDGRHSGSSQACRLLGWVLLALPALALAGCGAHRPLTGIPVQQVPDEWRHPITYRSGRQMIDLSLLRQTPPAEHRVDVGDVLGIYVEGVLGGDGQLPVVYTPQDAKLPPSMGYPVTVRGDGTVSLPGYEAFDVRGLTLRQLEDRVRSVCTGGDQPLLVQGNDRIIVSLQRPRAARVLVMRQEAGNEAGHGPQAGDSTGNRQKRGTGRIVELPAYRNDVLHALAETGGLPGLDAENVIYIIRGSRGRPAVAPPPAPVERSVHDPRRRAVFHSVRPSVGMNGAAAGQSGPSSHGSGVGRSGIQLVGARVHDPFLDGPNPFEPIPAQAGPAEPVRARPEAIEAWPGAPRPQASSPGVAPRTAELEPRQARVPLPILPGPEPMISATGHSTIDERFWRQEDLHWKSALPPLPPEHAAQTMVDPRSRPSRPEAVPQPQPSDGAGAGWTAGVFFEEAPLPGSRVVCIPLKLLPGEVPQFREDDIVLYDGDVVLVETREQDFFMTGGLLGGGQYPLPRDYDVTVIDAIAMVEQWGANHPRPTRSIGGVSALNQDVTVGASRVVLLRKLPDGCEIPIEIDLYEAIRNPQDRLIVQAGDRIILQYTRLEAIGAFIERHILDGAVWGVSSAAVFSD